MSKLKKAIERVGRHESGPLGFGHFQRTKRRAMLLAVIASGDNDAKAAAEAGADVILAESAAAVKQVSAGAAGAPVGVVVERLDKKTADDLAGSGVDFIASSFAATEATAIDTGRTGHVIFLEDGHDDAALRALGPLGLDALLVDRGADALTLERQGRFVRLAQLTATPLLFRVAPGIDSDELRVLRDSGGAAVVLPRGTSASDISKVIERLEQVPDPRRQDRESGIAVVPALLGHGHEHEEEEPEIE